MLNSAGILIRKGHAGWLALAALASQLFVGSAQAQILTDGNSQVNIVPGTNGMNSWTIDGQNQLNRQWFYIRNGGGSQFSLESLGAPVISQPSLGVASATYSSAQFSIQIVYSLVGGAAGSGTADLGEQIKIQNLTGSALNFHFFQYADFNVGGTANNSLVALGKNLKGLFNEARVTSGTMSIAEEVDGVISPGANRGEANLFDNTLANLLNTPNYMLNNATNAGPGHATWAFEWDPIIAAGGTFIISKDLHIDGVVPVPEPATWSLVSVGLIAFGALHRYRSRRG
jgi:hypothetical protein